MAGTLIKRNTAEGGTNGTTVTAPNSGGASGDAFDAVSIGAGNSLSFTNAAPLRGSLSYLWTKAAAVQSFAGWTWTGAQPDFSTNIRFRYPSAAPAVSEPILRLYSGAGYTPQVAGITLESGSTRRISVTDTATAATGTSTASLAVDTDYVAQVNWISGTSLTVTVYLSGTNTVAATATVAASAASVNSVRFGLTGSSNSACTLAMDDIQIGYNGLLDRLDVANVPPTITIGPDQNVSPGATVTLTATGTDSDGTITSYAWTSAYPLVSPPTLTGAATANPTFTAGAAGTLSIWKCTVTDNSGATAFANVEVRVPRAGSATSRPLASTGTGNTWTSVGSAPADVGALADESDATYLESGDLSATPTTRRVRLDPSLARATGNVKVKLWTDAGTANTTIRFIEGSTTRQTWTQVINTTITEYTYALSAATIAAVSDWGNLYLEVSATV